MSTSGSRPVIMPESPDVLADVALRVVTEASEAAKRGLARLRGGEGGVAAKGGNSADVVTGLDRGLDALIRRRLHELRPSDGIVSEEAEEAPGTSEIVWVCDPIDGSASLVHGGGSWAISLAATYRGESLAGVVSDVEVGETYVAKRGGGVSMNGRAIHVSAAESLAESIVATDFAHDRALRASQAEVLGRVAGRTRAMRNLGSTVLHLCWVASGRLDGMWQTTGWWWDVAAAGLCVTEAGGVLSDLEGGPMRPESVMACAPGIHRELVEVIGAGEAGRGVASAHRPGCACGSDS